jgi:hypothetical protein
MVVDAVDATGAGHTGVIMEFTYPYLAPENSLVVEL